jgi:hypothetical protein
VTVKVAKAGGVAIALCWISSGCTHLAAQCLPLAPARVLLPR